MGYSNLNSLKKNCPFRVKDLILKHENTFETLLNYWWLPVAEFLVIEDCVCVWMDHREVTQRSHRGHTEVTQRDLLHSSSLLLGKWWSYFSMVHKGTQFASVNKLPPMSWHWRYSDWIHRSLEESVWCLIYTHSHCSVSEQETVQTSGILECPSDQTQSSYSGLRWGPQIFFFPLPTCTRLKQSFSECHLMFEMPFLPTVQLDLFCHLPCGTPVVLPCGIPENKAPNLWFPLLLWIVSNEYAVNHDNWKKIQATL